MTCSAVFITETFTQLYKSIRYIDAFFDKENASVLFISETEPPARLTADYQIIRIRHKSASNAISAMIGLYREIRLGTRILDQIVSTNSEKTDIFCYTDNVVKVATLIDRLAKKYPEKTSFQMIEDGAALYSREYPFANSLISVQQRRILYRVLGWSDHSAKRPPHGLNPILSKVIASKPEILRDQLDRDDIAYEQMIEIYTPEFSEYLIKAFVGNDYCFRPYDFIFLTQPVYRDLINEDLSPEKLMAFIGNFAKCASKYGSLLIKNHPRDAIDYSVSCGSAADIFPGELSSIPFECFLNAIGTPAIFSLFSSVVRSERNGGPVYYLYPLLDMKIPQSINEEYIRENQITVIHSYEQLEAELAKLQLSRQTKEEK